MIQIPPTRAKSPKLGRKKGLSPADTSSNDGGDFRSVRLSLDENAALINNSKGVSPARSEKPKRRSLPRLPSEKSALSGVIAHVGKSPAIKVKNAEKPAAAAASTIGKKEEKRASTEKPASLQTVDKEKIAPSDTTIKVVASLSQEENGVATAEPSETGINSDEEEEAENEEEYHQHQTSVEEAVELEQPSNI